MLIELIESCRIVGLFEIVQGETLWFTLGIRGYYSMTSSRRNTDPGLVGHAVQTSYMS
jgi:hypothetical protein